MELKFLGRGAAFNPKEGNNSAYFIENKELFLIDCGESIFERVIECGLLEEVAAINLMITHTHSDHIGSLGTLVMYAYYKLRKPLNIVMKNDDKHLLNIEKILNGFGCTSIMYNYVSEEKYDNKFKSFQTIRYIETSHCDELVCYGLLFTTLSGLIYYSGDTKEIKFVKQLIESGKNINKLYIDTTSVNFSNNVHLYVGTLADEIPAEFKSKVYCMHFNNDECIEIAKNAGFNVVEISEKVKSKILK